MMLCGLLAAVSLQASRGNTSQTSREDDSFGQASNEVKTVVGCILQRNERFLVVNKKLPQGLEIRMTADLTQSVGLHAKVTGVFEYAAAPSHIQSKPLSGKSPRRIPVVMDAVSVTFMPGDCDENGMVRK